MATDQNNPVPPLSKPGIGSELEMTREKAGDFCYPVLGETECPICNMISHSLEEPLLSPDFPLGNMRCGKANTWTEGYVTLAGTSA